MASNVSSANLGNTLLPDTELSLGTVQAGLLITFSVFIVMGNTLTILAVYRTPRLRTIPNMYVVSLSAADILAGVSALYGSLSLIPALTSLFGNNVYLCISKYCLVFTFISASVTNLAAIAVDRYIYIIHPFTYVRKITVTKVTVIICVSWVFSVTLGTIILYTNNWTSGHRCTQFEVMPLAYHLAVSGILFFLGSFIILWCYGNILRVARQQGRQIRAVVVLAKNRNSQNNEASPNLDLKLDLKIIKVFLAVFGIFFLCWLPSVLGVFVELFVPVSERYMGFAIIFGILNSGMNVFIYAIKHSDFRHAFADILCSRRR